MSDEVTGNIIGSAIEVHKALGAGLPESIYEEALCHELEMQSIDFSKQVDVDVVYKGQVVGSQRLGLVVEGEVVVIIKSVNKTEFIDSLQVTSSLKAAGFDRGLLINFGRRRLIDGVRRIALHESRSRGSRYDRDDRSDRHDRHDRDDRDCRDDRDDMDDRD